jgi:hypothetical protein
MFIHDTVVSDYDFMTPDHIFPGSLGIIIYNSTKGISYREARYLFLLLPVSIKPRKATNEFR